MTWEWIAFFGAASIISVGCLVPARWLPPLPNDKLLHFLAFGVLTILTACIAHTYAEQAIWFFVLILAGWAIEILQNLVPGRRFCWCDISANVAGILVATVLSLVIRQL